jgi:hypothetical protein
LQFRKKRWSLTPKQEAAKIQKVLDALEHARLALVSSKVGFVCYESSGVREAMRAFTVKAERWRDGLKAMGRRSNINARKAHIEFWGELVALWKAITAGQAPRGLSHFVCVCSEPAFPEETTQGRVRTFLDRVQ